MPLQLEGVPIASPPPSRYSSFRSRGSVNEDFDFNPYDPRDEEDVLVEDEPEEEEEEEEGGPSNYYRQILGVAQAVRTGRGSRRRYRTELENLQTNYRRINRKK